MNSRYFINLIADLAFFLTPYSINIHVSPVFEETLLNIAGIKTQPKHTTFSDSGIEGTIHLGVCGIDKEQVCAFMHNCSVIVCSYHAPYSLNVEPSVATGDATCNIAGNKKTSSLIYYFVTVIAMAVWLQPITTDT